MRLLLGKHVFETSPMLRMLRMLPFPRATLAAAVRCRNFREIESPKAEQLRIEEINESPTDQEDALLS